MVAPASEVVVAKRALRKAMKAVLGALEMSQIASESAAVTAQVVARDEWVRASSVCAFCSMPGGEFSTRPLLEAAFAAKKRVFLPRVVDVKARRMNMYEAYSLEDVDAFPRSNWGIPEPPSGEGRADAVDETVDLVIVPGVAFDADFGRLGHGAGFYDTWFRAVDASKPFKLGVALTAQILPNGDHPDLGTRVPREDHDALLDLVLSPASAS